jgi:hypothetical protein
MVLVSREPLDEVLRFLRRVISVHHGCANGEGAWPPLGLCAPSERVETGRVPGWCMRCSNS